MKHATLPDVPNGWTKRIGMHLNFGIKGGAATYTVHDPDDEPTPIGYQYDTRKGGESGFTIAEVNEINGDIRLFKRWADVVAYWPEYVARLAAAEPSSSGETK